MDDDFIRTLASDTEDVADDPAASKKRSKQSLDDLSIINPQFTFDLSGDAYQELLAEQDISMKDVVTTGSKPQPISVDDIIARRKAGLATNSRKRKRDPSDEDEDSSEESSSASENDESMTSHDDSQENGSNADPSPTASGSSSSEEESDTPHDRERKSAFFAAQSPDIAVASSFLTMNLSRPIIKAITSLSFHTPTPIQSATIPVALLGKDVVGSAVTGSGKTAAFVIPILERLLYRDKAARAAATRCLVLVPTRELAIQCFEVGTKLAAHTDIRFALVVGGLSLKAQETTLRSRPDIVIATPGRLIDHLRNSLAFNLDALDVLVLDEADRMLSDGFADELTEIVKSCPKSRQTMLFSATMTDSVDELVKMSLNKPVRLFVDPKKTTAKGLVQEFVRVKAGRESDRVPLLVTLCKRTFKERVIIFFRSKKLAHQMRALFGLLDLKAEELHGDLTQEQRLNSLQLFRDSKVDYLMATDLASRGLDIKGIETVINFDMPGQLEQYLHRVGRTARAGRNGRSVTLVGEPDRKMLKAAIKHSGGEDRVRHRVVPPEAVEKWAEQVTALEDEMKIVLDEEREAKLMRKAEMELQKGENMLKHETEIFSRPARTWFQSSKDKANAKDSSRKQYEAGFREPGASKPTDETSRKLKRDKFAGLSRKAKRRKLGKEEDAKHKDDTVIKASIRAAKRAQRPTKVGEPEAPNYHKGQRNGRNTNKRKATKVGKGSGFGRDAGEISKRVREGARARRGDALGKAKGKGTKKR